ncbi:hypothetical protein [Streptomyces sp. NPDC048196]|uniref:hypothetical protein n=1 Tax=Streptomyces sp. NPDC048196 TaxID=3154712 RepID=UPI0033C782A0
MTLLKRAATMAATGALLGGSLVGLSATNAVAASHCGGAYVLKNNSSGYGSFSGSTPVYDDPYSDCSSRTYSSGTRFYYWCYLNNDYGNRWIFGRVDGADTTGFVYSGNITGSTGSLQHC